MNRSLNLNNTSRKFFLICSFYRLNKILVEFATTLTVSAVSRINCTLTVALWDIPSTGSQETVLIRCNNSWPLIWGYKIALYHLLIKPSDLNQTDENVYFTCSIKMSMYTLLEINWICFDFSVFIITYFNSFNTNDCVNPIWITYTRKLF